MAILLLNISAPMQSWGTELKLKDHPTDNYPSKSGIIGMIASAEGRSREENISDLASLKMAVRIDHEGTLALDYQTACIRKNVCDRDIKDKDRYLGYRYFLCDAKFMVAIEGAEDQLNDIAYNLRHPANALFLGRRGFPVNSDLVAGVFDEEINNSLHGHGYKDGMMIVEETEEQGDRMVKDQPVSYDYRKRQWKYRMIRIHS